jgi:ATP-dependent 26S proteasome regulatory subunit
MTLETKLTRSQEIAADVTAQLKARTPLIWIVSREEARVERYLAAAAQAAKYEMFTWDIAAGFRDGNGEPLPDVESSNDVVDALQAIAARSKGASRGLWVMRDLPGWLTGMSGATPLRTLRNLARALPFAELNSTQVIVVLSPAAEVPPELSNHATVIEWPLPDREEIGAALDEAIAAQGTSIEPLNGKRDAAIDASVGLTEEEALACFSRSMVQLKKIDPAIVNTEKRRVIAREKVLEWHDPLVGGLDAVGGLENVKAWLQERKGVFSPEAREYGLPRLKGIFLTGISGCGKTYVAKATATAFDCPLIRFDPGALKSKFVGESEANIRRAFKVIEAVGRCVVLVDEIEKALQGSTSGSSDGGTSSDQLGAILTWMQERQSDAFVIATANDVSSLPPELLRKGRFDELFFVDLPNRTERAQIIAAALRSHKRDLSGFDDFGRVADATEGFTGAEIAALVPEAMFAAFNDGKRRVVTGDLLRAAEGIVPLSKTKADVIARLKDWAKGRARPASIAEEKATGPRLRRLDIA